MHTPDHLLQPLWDLAVAPMRSGALTQALTLGLFEQLRQPATAAAVAKRWQLAPAPTVYWLDLLWSMGLLSRSDASDDTPAQYASSTLAQTYLCADAPHACGAAWRYRAASLAQLAQQWATHLRPDAVPPPVAQAAGSWAQAARDQIGQEQRAVTVPAVLRGLECLPPLPTHGRFLDLGGGPGHVGIALARHFPAWQGVICDEAQTAQVAQENIVAAGLGGRVRSLGADLNSEDFGHGYDLIWCSSVLHFMHSPQALVTRAAAALNPGGVLLLAHAESPEAQTVAARVLPFYGGLALRGRPLLQAGEVLQMLRTAGLHAQALGRLDFPLAPVEAYAGWRR